MKTIDLDEVKELVMKRNNYRQKYWGSLSLDDQAVLLDEVAYEFAKQCCDEHEKIHKKVSEALEQALKTIEDIHTLTRTEKPVIKSAISTYDVVTATKKSNLKYFGTSTIGVGHYFWDVYNESLENRGIDFSKCKFNPEKVVKTGTPFGTVIYERTSEYTVIAISGSPTDRRPGTKSVFWADLEMPYSQLKKWIMDNNSTKNIIEAMPFEIKWQDDFN